MLLHMSFVFYTRKTFLTGAQEVKGREIAIKVDYFLIYTSTSSSSFPPLALPNPMWTVCFN